MQAQTIVGMSFQKDDTDHEKRQIIQKPKNQRVYFLSFICTPSLLEDPSSKAKRFESDLWSNKYIKSIKQMSHYIEIAINHKKQAKKSQPETNSVKQLTNEYNLTDCQYQKALLDIKRRFVIDYPVLKAKIQQRPRNSSELEFESFVRSMRGKNFAAWFMPLREQAPKLRKLVISKQLVKILGYAPSQFHFQFQKYSDLAMQLMNGNAYKKLFLCYLTSFNKFMSMQVRNDISFQDCVKQSQTTIINQMKGKNQVQVKLQMRWSMPNMFTVCYQIIRILEQSEYRNYQMLQHRNAVMSKAEKTYYNSLSRITKLPKDMNPENNSKICSYQIIREPYYEIQSSNGENPNDRKSCSDYCQGKSKY